MRYFFLLISTLLLAGCEPAESPPLPPLGAAATPLVYDQFDEVAALFQQTSDTVYLVNFWATWCAPCREEIPLLQKLVAETDNPKLRVILVSLDTDPAAIARIPEFLKRAAPSVPAIVLTDEDPAWGATIDRLWSGSLPTTILYRGNLRYVYRREFRTYTDMVGAVAPLLE